MKKYISALLIIINVFTIFDLSVYASEKTLSAHDFFEQVQAFSDNYNPLGIAGSDVSDEPLNRLIVKTDSNEPLSEDYGAIATLDGYDGFHILQYPTISKASNALRALYNDGVEYVEYDFWVTIQDAKGFCYCSDNTYGETACNCKNDPCEKGFCACPDLHAGNHLSWNSNAANVDDAFDLITEKNIICETITVAVFDTGLYENHSYFDPERIVFDEIYHMEIEGKAYPSNEDFHYHGTHVAGTIYDNTMSNVQICPYRVFGESVSWLPYSVFCFALKSAIENEVDIINMSLRRKDYTETEMEEIEEGILSEGETLYDIFVEAEEKNIIIVVAAGNENNDAKNYIPSKYDEVITVAATTIENKPDVSYSNYGLCVDIAAPGTDICSTTPRVPTKNYIDNSPPESLKMRLSGTSMATPLVSAAAAMIKSIDPDITPAEVKRLIKETAYVPDNWEESCDGKNYGTGIVNFYNIAKAMLGEHSATPTISVNYDNKFEITAPEGTDSRIYYSLDGTVPTLDNHILYKEPFNLWNQNITRITAVCHENGKLIGEPIVYDLVTYDEKTVFYKWSDTLSTDKDTSKANWRSYNPNIASVDSDGNIKGVSKGNTRITCSLPSGEKIIWKVNVKYSPLQAFFVLFFFGFLWI